jgi:hypothetical protein
VLSGVLCGMPPAGGGSTSDDPPAVLEDSRVTSLAKFDFSAKVNQPHK